MLLLPDIHLIDSLRFFLPVRLHDFVVAEHDPLKVTIINPRTKNKGLNMFFAVAEQLPNVKFQIAGSLYDDTMKNKIDKLDNVTFLGWCDEMREVYQNTKLLLIPSQYEEGGPRIIPEAFANGIPVIGSDLGGIPDYVGDGGEVIADYNSVQPWVNAVKRFVEDDRYYQEKSEIARKRSQLFELDDRIDEIETILERHCLVQ
jgi:glycosyltransferase involved in cell wall biosynthesis